MGFLGCQALIAFYYNTPNNTLSTFWCTNNSYNWNPVFPREEETGKFPKVVDMKKRQLDKNKILYSLGKEGKRKVELTNNPEGSKFLDIFILLYINSAQKAFSIVEISKMLGISLSQASDRFDNLLEFGYISKNNLGIFLITDKGLECLKDNNAYNINLLALLSSLNPTPQEKKDNNIKDNVYVPNNFDKSFVVKNIKS